MQESRKGNLYRKTDPFRQFGHRKDGSDVIPEIQSAFRIHPSSLIRHVAFPDQS